MWHLENFSDDKLLDIVENYERYKYDISVKYEAEAILKKRGTVFSKKEVASDEKASIANAANSYLSQYKFRSIVTFALFVALLSVQFIVNSYTTLALFGFLLLLYLIMLFSCYFSHRNFYLALKNEKRKAPLVLFILIGFLFFPIYSIYQGNRMGNALPNKK